MKGDAALLGDDSLDLYHFVISCQFQVVGRACDDFEQAEPASDFHVSRLADRATAA